jgi:hypothetical protein
VYFEGSDGGVVRSDGQFADASDDCADRPLDDDSLVLCRKLLSRVPNQLYDTLNKGLSTLQFQSVSVDPKQPLHQVQGGTQDNGTFEWNSQLTTWDEEIYGDGGQSGYNYCNDKIRFNEFFDRYTDENFRDGFPKTWVITSGPLFNEGGSESAPFYMAQVTDYTNCGSVPGFDTAQAVALNANNTQNSQGNLIGPGRLGELGFQYLGMRHVWRTVDNGGPQDYLETNCIEFFVSGADRRCGDWKALAGPPGSGRPGDLASVNNYGGTKSGGSVVAVERDPGDSNTLWAATTAGRVFVTHNVNAVDPQAVQFCRLDDKDPHSPPRFVSSIYPDPANPNRAWISYSGYNSSTKDTPGHVFEVTATGAGSDGCPTAAVWRDLAVESGSTTHYGPADDIPILDLVRDDYTGTLYASTDFGVLQGTPSGANYVWTRAGSANFPFVAVSGLTIDPCSRVLYAATHGRSIWRMFLPAAKDAPSQGCPRTP